MRRRSWFSVAKAPNFCLSRPARHNTPGYNPATDTVRLPDGEMQTLVQTPPGPTPFTSPQTPPPSRRSRSVRLRGLGKGLRGIEGWSSSYEGAGSKGALVLSGAAVDHQEPGPEHEHADEGDLAAGAVRRVSLTRAATR